jgi:hypothetical protein
VQNAAKAAVAGAASGAAAAAAGDVTPQAATGASSKAEKGVTINADHHYAEDEDMEKTAKAEKDGIKTGLSPTEKAAMEASRAAMQARLKEAEDKWSVQVTKFQNALAEEKSTCGSAKAAALAAEELNKQKKSLQNKLIAMQKAGAKSKEKKQQ